MDAQIFHLLNGLVGKNHLFDVCIYFFAVIAIFLFPLFSFHLVRSGKVLMEMIFSSSIAYSINAALALLWYRERPFHEVSAHVTLDTSRLFDSFPSDHTAIAFAAATTIFFASRMRGNIALILALFIGVARVITGVHYPTDIVGGIFTGCIAAWIVRRFIVSLQSRV